MVLPIRKAAGDIQFFTDYTAVYFIQNFFCELCQLFFIRCIGTSGCKLVHDRVFCDCCDCCNTEKPILFHKLCKLSEGVVISSVSIRYDQHRTSFGSVKFFQMLQSHRWNSSAIGRNANHTQDISSVNPSLRLCFSRCCLYNTLLYIPQCDKVKAKNIKYLHHKNN